MMITSYRLVALALAACPGLAIPPPEFGFVDSANHTELSVAFTFDGNTTVVQEGQLFGGNITSQQPALAVNPAAYQSVADYNGDYVILMIDPDAPSPDSPTSRFILHWLAANVTQGTTAEAPLTGQRALTNSTPAFVPYRAPTPPLNSSAHRYIIYAFAQPDNFAIPESFSGFSAQNRSLFSLDRFISEAGLGRPMAGEFWYVSREPEVPGTFVALAGGAYPGGNGAAIFSAGSGSATATATSSASSTSSTGGAASTGTSAANVARASYLGLYTCLIGGAGLLGLTLLL
ncbi:hypothetical protein N8I77_010613 [Diaporthe amygdali]|uniref:PEBP-like protein n=1 Tax=Phomopsis amygdali TaxID=1214568 RepID=A0AAD9S8Q0_PHOAM|nr:phosphatidylethanolamine-binding protein pebp [Diaporthe amygdali]KAJ0123634.1 phosphatidylethanolamine-binding protein pebp [Diaporthe amygdali]KAK2601143.1 hypothetical protein N8I77_010613 [Diaporthe amygdali]